MGRVTHKNGIPVDGEERPIAQALERNFRDWEQSTFGFGYGSGEPHIIPTLRRFFELCPHQYDYQVIEAALTPTVTWLLINVLGHAGMIDYGTSPRFAWLTKKGHALREFMLARTDEQLVEIACTHSEDDPGCSPTACNCGPNGYQEGVTCDNPFWKQP